MKGGTKGLYCLYDKCNFHHLKNKQDYNSLSSTDRSTLGKYTNQEETIEWGIDIAPTKLTFKEKVKVEVIKDNSSSTEDEDVTALSKPKTSLGKKSKKVKA